MPVLPIFDDNVPEWLAFGPDGEPIPTDPDAMEPYCRACLLDVGRFSSRTGEWEHLTGDPLLELVEPLDVDHAPVVGWRPAMGALAKV
jgi:hypothetical protein